jgi:hypothetical protein
VSTYFLFSPLFAQESSLLWNEQKPLSWADFSGQVKDSSAFDAEVFAEVRYKYTFYSLRDFQFEVFAIFNRNTSWSRTERRSEELLKHEQLHFDIAALHAQKLKDRFNSYNYTENFEQEIQQIFSELKEEYQAAQLKCDEETNHSVDKAKQLQWEQYVRNELIRLKSSLSKN